MDLLVKILDVGVISVKLLVEGPYDLLLLIDLFIDFGQFVLHHGPEDVRHFVPTVVLFLLLLGCVEVHGARAATSHCTDSQLLNIINCGAITASSYQIKRHRYQYLIWQPSHSTVLPSWYIWRNGTYLTYGFEISEFSRAIS